MDEKDRFEKGQDVQYEEALKGPAEGREGERERDEKEDWDDDEWSSTCKR